MQEAQKEQKAALDMLAKQMAQIATSLNEMRGNGGRIPAAPEAPGRENANAVVSMTEEHLGPKDKQLPQKQNDPGVFTLPISIGEVEIKDAMCDLGASINILPLSICKELKGVQLTKANITLQLADKTAVTPEGVIEDVLIKVGDASYPADFHVLNMGEPESAGSSGVLLGRPFLKTAKALIDVSAGMICLDYLGERLTFPINGGVKRPTETEVLHTMNVSRPLGRNYSLEEQGGVQDEGIEQEMADWWEDLGSHGLTDEEISEAILEFCQKPNSSWSSNILLTDQAEVGEETESSKDRGPACKPPQDLTEQGALSTGSFKLADDRRNWRENRAEEGRKYKIGGAKCNL